MIKQDQTLLQTRPTSINSLYDSYAAMLLGYVTEVVKDRTTAEEYLVKIFNKIDREFDQIKWDGSNTWCQLQRFAKTELAAFNNAVHECETPAGNKQPSSTPNKYLDQMTEEQKHIFCSFYYNRKTTVALSEELGKSEELIKKLLKDAFVIIRRSHEN